MYLPIRVNIRFRLPSTPYSSKLNWRKPWKAFFKPNVLQASMWGCGPSDVVVDVLQTKLQEVEGLGATLEEALVLDNAYTEHSTVGLAQQWDQLEQLGMRMEHNLEQQIQARCSGGGSLNARSVWNVLCDFGRVDILAQSGCVWGRPFVSFF